MSQELVTAISTYISEVICGFESGMYKMVLQENKDRIKLLSNKHHPFITIFRDLHEEYYTRTCNSIVKRDNNNIVNTFDKFKKLSNHSDKCVLNILANLAVSIHFNLDRKTFTYQTHDQYMSSVKKEVSATTSIINISKLFDHVCLTNNELELIPDGKKFIEISMAFKSNGVAKSINSFTA